LRIDAAAKRFEDGVDALDRRLKVGARGLRCEAGGLRFELSDAGGGRGAVAEHHGAELLEVGLELVDVGLADHGEPFCFEDLRDVALSGAHRKIGKLATSLPYSSRRPDRKNSARG